MSSEAFHQMEVFCDLFEQKGQDDVFLKRPMFPANRRPAEYNQHSTLHSIVWLYEVYRVTAFECQTFSTILCVCKDKAKYSS